jgi:hypothetical protein
VLNAGCTHKNAVKESAMEVPCAACLLTPAPASRHHCKCCAAGGKAPASRQQWYLSRMLLKCIGGRTSRTSSRNVNAVHMGAVTAGAANRDLALRAAVSGQMWLHSRLQREVIESKRSKCGSDNANGFTATAHSLIFLQQPPRRSEAQSCDATPQEGPHLSKTLPNFCILKMEGLPCSAVCVVKSRDSCVVSEKPNLQGSWRCVKKRLDVSKLHSDCCSAIIASS